MNGQKTANTANNDAPWTQREVTWIVKESGLSRYQVQKVRKEREVIAYLIKEISQIHYIYKIIVMFDI